MGGGVVQMITDPDEMGPLVREDCGTVIDRSDSRWLRGFYILVALLAIGTGIYWVRG